MHNFGTLRQPLQGFDAEGFIQEAMRREDSGGYEKDSGGYEKRR